MEFLEKKTITPFFPKYHCICLLLSSKKQKATKPESTKPLPIVNKGPQINVAAYADELYQLSSELEASNKEMAKATRYIYNEKPKKKLGNIEILILKTDFGRHRGENVYWKNQPVIPSNLASILKNKFKKLRAFGFDLISLTSKLDREEGKKAHIEFLINNDILIIEDMSLSKLKKTPKMIVVSPLMIDKADGVPCNILSFS